MLEGNDDILYFNIRYYNSTVIYRILNVYMISMNIIENISTIITLAFWYKIILKFLNTNLNFCNITYIKIIFNFYQHYSFEIIFAKFDT